MDWDQVWMGLVIGLPVTALGVLGYKRSQRVDAGTGTRADIAQLIDGLQEDNKTFREEIRLITGRLDACFKENQELTRRLNRLNRLYGDNGDAPLPTP